jgi:hypothetical protein
MNTRFAWVPVFCMVVLWTGCTSKVPSPVEPDVVTDVAITPDRPTIFVGEQLQFTATVTGQGANVDRSVTWTSSNTSVATVDANGKVTAHSVGKTDIVARSKANTEEAATTTLTVIIPVPVVFNITATKTIDTGCNFTSSFVGKLEATVASSTGAGLFVRMIERLTREYMGMLNATGAFNATGSGNLDGFQYSGTVAGMATATTIQGTETLNFTTGCAGKQVVYQFTGQIVQ